MIDADNAEAIYDLPARLVSRADLTALLAASAADVRAESYLLVAIQHDHDQDDARVVASNWMYDAIQLIGTRQMARLVLGAPSATPGRPATSLDAMRPSHSPAAFNDTTAGLLVALGHGELFVLRVHVGRQRYFLVLSAAAAGRIETARLPDLQMRCCYALSRAPDLLASVALTVPLSDRERECLYWVSEGKTSDDIAVILSVSSNTANGYITNAMQRLGACNRSMAIATAIRGGII